jgi:signal transduction histidine kinase
MQNLDFNTFIFVVGFLYITMTVLTYFALKKQMTESIKLWILSGFLLGTSLLLFFINKSTENSIEIVFIAGLFFLANAIRAYSLHLDIGKRYSIVNLLILMFFIIFVYGYVTLVLQSVPLRAAMMSLVGMVLYSVIALFSYRIARTEQSFNAYLISFVYGLVVVAMLFRGVQIMSQQRGVNLLENDLPQMLLVISVLLTVVVGHVSYIGLMLERNKKKEIEYQTDKARQEEAYDLNSKIMQLDRQRSLGMVAMSFSHELNQPLNGVFLSAEVALRGLVQHKLTETQHTELLERMLVNIDHAKKILHRLGSFISPSSAIHCPVNLEQVVQNVLYLVHPLCEDYALDVRYQPLTDNVSVKGDVLALTQVVLNVVRNAIESVQNKEFSFVQISVHLVDDDVWLIIEDSGDGFSDQALKEIGQSMVTTKPEGLGMGLLVSQNIIEQHHGRMMFENNTEREGAKVTIILPRMRNISLGIV